MALSMALFEIDCILSLLAGERPIGRMAFCNIIKMQEAISLWLFLENILQEFWIYNVSV